MVHPLHIGGLAVTIRLFEDKGISDKINVSRIEIVFMKILYIARTDTYRYYREGINPSYWLYGAVEMEKDGNEVVWEDESRA